MNELHLIIIIMLCCGYVAILLGFQPIIIIWNTPFNIIIRNMLVWAGFFLKANIEI